ncbi:beta strand repeat-containing protein, partial [Cohnella boryungensis]
MEGGSDRSFALDQDGKLWHWGNGILKPQKLGLAVSAASPAKEITAFGFATPAVTGTVNEENHTISVNVPYGTDVTALTPTITHTGASVSPNSGAARNFTNPVTYTVTAADGSTQDYTVTVTVVVNPAKAITAFGFATPAVTGRVNEGNHTISVTVPYGTNVTALTPTITHTGASISPNNGATRNFTNPVIYTVTAEDGSTQDYTVTVTVASGITSFAFESLGVTGTVDEERHIIRVEVPYGTDITSLTPTITHTGWDIHPKSGVAQDFSIVGNVHYRLDGSVFYAVGITVAANPAKEITAFGFASPAATGTVDEGNHTIAITVPYGTDVRSLTPTIAHTGASILPNNGVAQNFTNPVTYKVTAENRSTQNYTVTVDVAANPAKAITAFSFTTPAVSGTVNEANHTIAITVPYGTNVASLTPTITHSGASISPTSGTVRNFTNPVMYTVRAADGSTQNYTVTVNVAANPAKAITAFSFANPAVTVTVTEANHTIAITVPYGTNVASLTPTIAHTGASISPNSGTAQNFTNPVTYRVTAADGSTQNYTVTVNVAANPAKAITAFSFAAPAVTGTVNEANHTISVNVPYGTNVTALTPTIAHTGASISPTSGTVRNFTNPVMYTVRAADGSTQNYVVTVNVAANPAKAITAFSFASLAVMGTVNEANHTISVNVPYGTNVTALTPTIVHTGASISPTSGTAQNFTNPVTYRVTAADGSTQNYVVTVNVAANPAKAITAFSFAAPTVTGTVNEANHTISVNVPYGTNVTALTPTIVHTGASISPTSGSAQNFTNPVTYRVTAADGSTQNYTVTVNVAANPAKAITAFSFTTPSATGTVNEANHTIAITVPYGTNVASLTPTITHTGASILPGSGTARNFTNPVTYTVTAADGSTQNYAVTVNVAANPAKAITAFSFTTPAATGTVNEANHTIAVTVPYGTDVTSLTPTIAHTGASISPTSGAAQDFTNPVTYTVTAADGSTQNYTVTVNVAANPAKAITAFSFTTPSATGTVNEANHTIAITVPYGTNVASL